MEIDIQAIEAELSLLTPEQMKQQLLDAKVKQKVATKKYYNADTAKKARQKKAEQTRQLTAKAKLMPATKLGFANLYEQIEAEAKELAEAKLAEEAADEFEEEVVA